MNFGFKCNDKKRLHKIFVKKLTIFFSFDKHFALRA